MNADPNSAKTLFLEAVERHAPDQWPAFLDRACAGQLELRSCVEALLEAHREVGTIPHSVLSEGANPGQVTTVDMPCPAECVGAVFGPYKLLEQVGEGGMGTVWMAQQTEPVKRLVAVKLIKAGMDSKQVIARFEAERQALALMDHPNIARVLDAGTTGGRPYFVMDLVKGVPITRYCDEHHLTPRQRLELFLPVCQAVQHAHQKGIIHRDLKPTNVLVAHYDGRPVPKVIDFGVAKAAGQALTDKTLVTGFGNIVGTLEYMSPEQAEVNQLDIDTRSDIYSLGVLLYELLAGSPPFTRKELEKAGMVEMLRVIREQEPTKPSTKLSSAEGLPTLAANRGTEPAKLTKLLRGELDWIVMKALEKDRNRRYETANGFAMDVQRYLADEAVQACPPSAGYRLRKFARKNRRLLATLTAFIIVLLLATGFSVWQAYVANHAKHDALAAAAAETTAKDAANAKEKETSAVLDFVEKRILAAARPKGLNGGLGYNVELRDALRAALPMVDKSFAGQPLVEARVRMTLGESFDSLGEFQTALEQQLRARTLLTQHLGADDLQTIECISVIARSYKQLGDFQEALRMRQEILKMFRSRMGPEDPRTLAAMINVAGSYLGFGRYEDNVRLLQPALPILIAKKGEDDDVTLAAMNNLAAGHAGLHQSEEALKLYERVLKLRREKPSIGPDHPHTIISMNNLANCYVELERHDEALKLRREALEKRRRTLGEENPDTWRSMANLAASYDHFEWHDKALELQQKVLAKRTDRFTRDHPDTLWSMWDVAGSLSKLKKAEESLKVVDECILRARNQVVDPDLLPGCFCIRARCHDQLRNPAECRASAEMCEQLPLTDRDAIFKAACCRAITAHAVRATDTTQAGAVQADVEADRAMAWLKKAVDAGYKNVEKLKKVSDLDAIRDRPDFKKLVGELEAKQKELQVKDRQTEKP